MSKMYAAVRFLPLPRFALLSWAVASALNAVAADAPAEGQSVPSADVKKPSLKVEDAARAKAAGKVDAIEIKGASNVDERRQSTASKIVVNHDEVVKYGDSNLGDVLKRLPGVTLGGTPGRGGEIRMRGLGSGYTQIMINGEPAPPGFSLDSLSPEMVERIEIMRSPTAEFSTQAIAGGINIVLKEKIKRAQHEIKAGVGEDNGKYNGGLNLQLSDQDGPFSYAVNSGFYRYSYRWDGTSAVQGLEPAGRVNREAESHSYGDGVGFNIAPRLNWRLGNANNLTWQSFVNLSHSKNDSDSQTHVMSGPLPAYLDSESANTGGSSMVRSNLNWVRRFDDGAKIDAKFGVNYNRNYAKTELETDGRGSHPALDRLTRSTAEDYGFTAGGKYSTPWREAHALAIGWDGAWSRRVQDATTVDNGVLQNANLGTGFTADVSRLALFAQDEWEISKKWSIYGGLRWETLNTKSGSNAQANVDNRANVLSPLLQSMWRLGEGESRDQVRVGISRTYRAPQTSSLMARPQLALENTPLTPDSAGNPQLQPELAWGLDVAYEHYLSQGGMMSVSVFARNVDDLMRNLTSKVDGRWVNRPENVGKAQVRGIELELKSRLAEFMDDAPAVDLRVSASRYWSHVDYIPGPDNRLDSQTPYSANIGFDWKLATVPVTWGASLSLQGAGPIQVSSQQRSESSVKRTLDVYGLYKVSAQAQVRLALSNVLHQQYNSQSHYLGNGYDEFLSSKNATTAGARVTFEYKF
ncbi:TonB-dependent receptor [Burkholderiaceae bacterium DAT-1]|nr:TonB-dependent receptor [Burkholderiaceae bacterium DAT-1]